MHVNGVRRWLLVGVLVAAAMVGCGRDESSTPPAGGATAPAAGASGTAAPETSNVGTATAVVATATAGPSPAATAPSSSPPPAGPAPAPTAAPPGGGATSLRSVTLSAAFGGRRFGRPIELAPYPGGRLLLAEQEGLVSLLGADGSAAGTLLDIRAQTSRAGNEEGLLSVALDPGFPGRPYLYAYYSVAGGQRRTRLARFEVASDVAAPGSERIVLEQPQPFNNHNGGAIRFGPDGMLYLGLGDGGSGGDPQGNGQNLGTWLGKVLRIDVRGADASRAYTVPADNPFIGTQGALPEIWAFGFRNPWRMAFDPATGVLWAGDVGQNEVEEIDVVRRGGNYGWNRFEGTDCYRAPCPSAGMVAPVAQYRHSEGCSVSGGVVYRGSAVPKLVGWYLYADFCSGRVWGVPVDGGTAVQLAGAQGGRSIASWGVDAAGEVYALVHGGAVLRVTGAD